MGAQPSEIDRLDRREFIKRVGRTSLAMAGAALGAVYLRDSRESAEYFREHDRAPALRLPSFRVERQSGSPTLAIARGQNPAQLARAALGALGGIESFVGKGDVVLLKPNAAFDRPPSLGATTRPELLGAVALMCREAGASRVLVADNPINQPEGCFFKTGIQQAATEAGAELSLPRPGSFAQLQIDGQVLQTWPFFYEPFETATKVIGIAPCKDHNLCSASMTMKNWYGLLGGRRNQFHQQIHGIIADFPRLIEPTLVILDATRMLMRNGPTGGSLGDVAAGNTLVAGTDMVAVDTVGYTLLGRDPSHLEYLHRAQAAGLGTTRWKELNWREVQV
jgi:uncharacterized protein (DUF362 family)